MPLSWRSLRRVRSLSTLRQAATAAVGPGVGPHQLGNLSRMLQLGRLFASRGHRCATLASGTRIMSESWVRGCNAITTLQNVMIPKQFSELLGPTKNRFFPFVAGQSAFRHRGPSSHGLPHLIGRPDSGGPEVPQRLRADGGGESIGRSGGSLVP